MNAITSYSRYNGEFWTDRCKMSTVVHSICCFLIKELDNALVTEEDYL